MTRVTMATELIDERPDGLMDDMPDGSLHWKCVLRYQKRRMTIYFSQGPAICREPTARDVLECLLSDVCRDHDFESWARDLGFSTDSRRAEQIYIAAVRQTAELHRLLGDDHPDFDADNELAASRLAAV